MSCKHPKVWRPRDEGRDAQRRLAPPRPRNLAARPRPRTPGPLSPPGPPHRDPRGADPGRPPPPPPRRATSPCALAIDWSWAATSPTTPPVWTTTDSRSSPTTTPPRRRPPSACVRFATPERSSVPDTTPTSWSPVRCRCDKPWTGLGLGSGEDRADLRVLLDQVRLELGEGGWSL